MNPLRLLRIAAFVVLASMIAVTVWASSQVALWKVPREVTAHPWFIATLFDTYFGFLAFWAWVAYKERTVTARAGWLVAIFLLGNIAMAGYMLLRLRRLPAGARVEDLLLREPEPPRTDA